MGTKIDGAKLNREMKAAIKKTGLTIDEWKAIYQPTEKANECCIACAKAYGGCNWSKSFKPVEGWIAEEMPFFSANPKDTVTYKIYLCPEFEKDGKHNPEDLDHERCVDLLCMIAKSCTDELICAYRAIKALRPELSKEMTAKYREAISNASMCEQFFSNMPSAIEHCREQARFKPVGLEEVRALRMLEVS